MNTRYRVIETSTGEEFGIVDTIDEFEVAYEGRLEEFHTVKTSVEEIAQIEIMDKLEQARILIRDASYSLDKFKTDQMDEVENYLNEFENVVWVAGDEMKKITGKEV